MISYNGSIVTEDSYLNKVVQHNKYKKKLIIDKVHTNRPRKKKSGDKVK